MRASGPSDCIVVDAGARYGLHPSWRPAERVARFDLYEAEPIEAGRLKDKYLNFPNVSVHSQALSAKAGDITFGVRRHRALSSRYSLSAEAIREGYKGDEFDEVETITVHADSLDNIYPSANVHFLKLDVEGAEVEVLHGAHELLTRSIQGVRSEICFSPIFSGAPVFGDVDTLLRSYGLILLNLDYDGRGVAKSPFTLGSRFGRLYSSDGVWVQPNEVLRQRPTLEAQESLLRQSLFLILNGASDYAVDALRMWVEVGGQARDQTENPLFNCLKRHVAILFKDLHYEPQMDKHLLLTTWTEIFSEPFPELNAFWESLDQ